MKNFLKNIFSGSPDPEAQTKKTQPSNLPPSADRPAGCEKLAGDNIPGKRPSVPPRPERAPENSASALLPGVALAKTGQPFNASTCSVPSEPEHARTSKIARLPKDLRDQLNHRIENGDPASEILPWLNELPLVKTILTRHFDGVPVSDKNLTIWRQGGYQCWLQKREPLALIKELKEDATDISRTGEGSLAGAAATVVSARILQILQAISGNNLSADDLAKAAFAITTLLKAEQNNVRLQHEKTRICQRDHEILLKRDKHQRDVVAIGLRLLGDARAKQIETSSAPYAEKVELLGRHMFPELWQSRPVPENGAPQPPEKL